MEEPKRPVPQREPLPVRDRNDAAGSIARWSTRIPLASGVHTTLASGYLARTHGMAPEWSCSP